MSGDKKETVPVLEAHERQSVATTKQVDNIAATAETTQSAIEIATMLGQACEAIHDTALRS